MLKNKKGFTLVELLVVIAIMAILAAILIPSFAKYVERANEAKYLAEVRAAHVAASVVVQDAYIADRSKSDDALIDLINNANNGYKQYAPGLGGIFSDLETTAGTIDEFTYTVNDSWYCVFDGTTYDITIIGRADPAAE